MLLGSWQCLSKARKEKLILPASRGSRGKLMRHSLLVFALCVQGCASAGPYGYSRTYSPLDAEEDAAENAREYDPVMAEREKQEWKKQPSSLFGVVTSRNEGKGGEADLTLSVRTLAPRNLCDQDDEDTCRVTVSDREHAIIHARVKLSAQDAIGEHALRAGSLVRVIGKLTDELDATDGTPVIRASYYRHWPRNFFVTTADRDHMQR
jgi:hypothetical protein